MIQLTNIDEVYPASYNPRERDRERIELLKLSILKLGFLLPIYANQDKGILSGHQRQQAARELGIKQIPVEFLNCDDEGKEMMINIAFNKGTNDFSKNAITFEVNQELKEQLKEIGDLINRIPDKKDDEMFPCMSSVSVSSDLLKINNRDQFSAGAMSTYGDLYDLTKVIQPIVITNDYRIVNGIGRFFYCLSKGIKSFQCVVISNDEAQLARLMLNKLTMDFNVKDKYADILRYNSYRRASGVRNHLGMAYTVGITSKSAKSIDIYNPVDRMKFKHVYGSRILDFGAGLMEEIEMLKTNGFDAVGFEPFTLKRVDGRPVNDLCLESSRKTAKNLIDEVATGKPFDSIISQTILNSIPFDEDRKKYLLILSFLCDEKTTAFIGTNSVEMVRIQQTDNVTNSVEFNRKAFRMEYESGVTLGELKKDPKMQKHFTDQEVYDLCIPYFEAVNFTSKRGTVYCICRGPKLDFSMEELKEAVDFEFNLPYPDGERLNMHDQAWKVFSKRAKKLKIR